MMCVSRARSRLLIDANELQRVLQLQIALCALYATQVHGTRAHNSAPSCAELNLKHFHSIDTRHLILWLAHFDASRLLSWHWRRRWQNELVRVTIDNWNMRLEYGMPRYRRAALPPGRATLEWSIGEAGIGGNARLCTNLRSCAWFPTFDEWLLAITRAFYTKCNKLNAK